MHPQDTREQLEYFAPCPMGLESVCADELKAMGIRRVRPLKSGVAFFGSLEDGYRACLWSRCASRILLLLARIDAHDADALYAGAKALPWEEHMGVDSSFAVDASGVNEQLRNTQFTGMRLKDALCDRFRELEGRRPNVDSSRPDLLINVALRGDKATVSLDLSGGSLHKRGYRKPGKQAVAPLKESLAAGMLLLADWPSIADKNGAFLDPFCGSGTLCIEAALMAGDVAPGILRSHWGFEGWLKHEPELWQRLLDEADRRADEGRSKIPPIFASDNDPAAIELASSFAARAGLRSNIVFSVADACELTAPQGVEPGLLACNPPYGERMSNRAQLPALYAAFASCFRRDFAGWQLAVISSDPALDNGLGMEPVSTKALFNGRIESPLHLYAPGAPAPELLPGTEQFSARISKMYAHRRKWARRQGIGCYRLYDADLPDYNLAVDVYVGAGPDDGQTWAQVFEYAAPSEIDEAKARRRLQDALRVLPQLLEIPVDHVFLKQRLRAKGGSQYAQEALESPKALRAFVEEKGLVFEVDMASYLDTGIFPDHRETRELIRSKAAKARFLNLFAYTGSATVYAADGDAFSTTTVDLSQTYLAWAQRNMEANGFKDASHEFVRADCLRWVEEQRHSRNRWDLIFVDPPTFSNSNKMGNRSWDVQRDHAEFLISVSRLLTRQGLCIFSTNLRDFQPDLESLAKAGVELRDISASTIPDDFARNKKIHKVYELRRVKPE